MRTILFFDDWPFLTHQNVRRRWFQAEPWPGLEPATDPSLAFSYGSPTVIREPDGRWRMWAMGIQDLSKGDAGSGTYLYKSRDGLNWERDPHGEATGKPASAPEQHRVFKGEKSAVGAMPFRDEREPDPRRRYKLAYSDNGETVNGVCGVCRIAVSPDGVHWEIDRQAVWRKQHTDTMFSIAWNPYTRKYQFTGRPVLLDRRVALYQTSDWKTFDEPLIVEHPDPSDPDLIEFYGMPHFHYEGYFVGFLWKMWGAPKDLYGTTRMMGVVDSELTYSINGIAWNRTNRQPLLKEESGPGWGAQYPASLIADDEGWLRIYTASCRGEHADHGKLPKGTPAVQLTVSRLRKDGFCAMETRSGTGTITTRNFIPHGGPLTINAETRLCGAVRAELRGLDNAALPGFELSACVPIIGNHRDATLRWISAGKTLETLDTLQGKPIRIHFELDEARLYAFRINADILFGQVPATDLAGHFIPNTII